MSFLLLGPLMGATGAQTPTPASATPKSQRAEAAAPSRTESRIEKITHEDGGSRIDELRVGGDTKNITVSPKGGMPPYEVGTSSANRQPGANDRESSTGTRGWKIFGF